MGNGVLSGLNKTGHSAGELSKTLDLTCPSYFLLTGIVTNDCKTPKNLVGARYMQSDGVVFIYRLGLEWGEKKSICAKLPANSPVTSIVWPPTNADRLYFGALDGKVSVPMTKLCLPFTGS